VLHFLQHCDTDNPCGGAVTLWGAVTLGRVIQLVIGHGRRLGGAVALHQHCIVLQEYNQLEDGGCNQWLQPSRDLARHCEHAAALKGK